MERVISMGERLQRLLTEAEKEAEAMIVDAERSAEEMISKAKDDAERRRTMAQRGYGIDELLNEAEENAKKEAERNILDYEKKAKALKEIPQEKIEESVAFVLKEVLPE
jgi:vacuolar-type H+-ATPase subunit H